MVECSNNQLRDFLPRIDFGLGPPNVIFLAVDHIPRSGVAYWSLNPKVLRIRIHPTFSHYDGTSRYNSSCVLLINLKFDFTITLAAT